MTIHPRSLGWNENEPRPARPEWWCTVHGRLIIGDNRCPRCDVEQEREAS